MRRSHRGRDARVQLSCAQPELIQTLRVKVDFVPSSRPAPRRFRAAVKNAKFQRSRADVIDLDANAS